MQFLEKLGILDIFHFINGKKNNHLTFVAYFFHISLKMAA